MKQSKKSSVLHIIGVFFFGLSGILYLFSSKMEVLFLGFFALCIFWILGIEEDLYRKGGKLNE